MGHYSAAIICGPRGWRLARILYFLEDHYITRLYRKYFPKVKDPEVQRFIVEKRLLHFKVQVTRAGETDVEDWFFSEETSKRHKKGEVQMEGVVYQGPSAIKARKAYKTSISYNVRKRRGSIRIIIEEDNRKNKPSPAKKVNPTVSSANRLSAQGKNTKTPEKK